MFNFQNSASVTTDCARPASRIAQPRKMAREQEKEKRVNFETGAFLADT
jgi:hypothetical protein